LLDELGPTNAALERYEAYRRPRARWILDQSHTLGRVAQLEGSVVRWLRNLALRLTPPSTNTRALRRIVSEMPGVPVAARLGS
ncbi:MAG TPA: hypothetical protein VLC09_10900, partial [Polyangiaceae bacterium]|nr:hypothetical protein [Polyangiaceae bacterium]